jgi:hypothetical protein
MFMFLLLDAYPTSLLVLSNRNVLVLGRQNAANAVSTTRCGQDPRSGYRWVPVLLPITA